MSDAYEAIVAYVSPEYQLQNDLFLIYRLRKPQMPTVPLGNQAILAVSLAKVNELGTKTYVTDATVKASVVELDPIATVLTSNLDEIGTVQAHGLSTGDMVVVDGVLGNFEQNGHHTVTVVDPTTFTLDGVTGNANYTTGGRVYRVVSGLGDVALTYVATSPDGRYAYTIPAETYLESNQRYSFFTWATDVTHGGKFFRKFDLPLAG